MVHQPVLLGVALLCSFAAIVWGRSAMRQQRAWRRISAVALDAANNEVPEVVLYYQENLQAYRTDRWTGFVTQPQPQGAKLYAYSNYSYLSLHAKSAADAAAAPSSGVSGFVWLIALVVAALIIGAVFLVRRRGEEDRA